MGFLRFFLALAVAQGHIHFVDPRLILSENLAVDCFFVISGYYMAMILDQKYKGLTSRYWLNRILRIWPTYLAVLAASTLLVLGLYFWKGISTGPIYYYQTSGIQPGLAAWAYIGLTQLSIVGHEWSRLIMLDPQGSMFWGIQEKPACIHIDYLFIVPQAWTLGMEEIFYLAAPFYSRLRRSLIALIFLTGLITVASEGQDWLGAFAFPPLCLTVFAGGIWSYQLAPVWKWTKPKAWATALIFVLGLLSVPFWPLPVPFARALLLLLAVPGVSALFELSRLSTLDRAVGAYSYPFYLSHLIVLWTLGPISSLWGFPVWLSKASILAGILLASWLLLRLVERPLAPLRRRVAEGGRIFSDTD